MKFHYVVVVVTCVFLCGSAFAQSQSVDKEISTLAEKLAAQVKESGRKKITVLDFADLQGRTTELGRFLAEQLSVSLVERRSGFSIMDRANLKTILAEHKLTVEGLIDPENAKKLGLFSGVDAIVLGSVTTLADEVAITTKIIATDTAEIVGAAKARIPKAKEIAHLLESAISNGHSLDKAVLTDKTAVADKPQLNLDKLLQIERNSLQVDDLFIKVESFRYTQSSQYGDLTATLVMVNTNLASGIGAAVEQKSPVSIATSSRGFEFNCCFGGNDFSGIGLASGRGNDVRGDLTEIPPGKSIKVVVKYLAPLTGKGGNFAPYRLQFGIYTGKESQGHFANVKWHNCLIDVDAAK